MTAPTTINAGLLEAMSAIAQAAERPIGTDWRLGGDDLCDCTFQTIWETTNPYIGKTQRVRICCLVERLAEQHPDLIAMLDGWHDVGRQQLVETPLPWDHDGPMPPRLWYRQIATITGNSLAAVRQMYRDRTAERPMGGVKTFVPASASERQEAIEAERHVTGWIA